MSGSEMTFIIHSSWAGYLHGAGGQVKGDEQAEGVICGHNERGRGSITLRYSLISFGFSVLTDPQRAVLVDDKQIFSSEH